MSVSSATLAGVTADVAASCPPATHALHVQFDCCVITVQCNDRDVFDALADYYRIYRCDPTKPADLTVTVLEAPRAELSVPFKPYPPEPGKTRIKDETIDLAGGRLLRKRQTGMVFGFCATDGWVMGPCSANLNQVINFINNRWTQRQIDRGYLLCHAAAVAKGPAGIAIAGVSGRGKSTLALHLVSRGWDFVSNDRLLIRAGASGCRMLGVPKFPRINPGTVLNNPDLHPVIPADQRAELAKLPADALWSLEQKYDVDVIRLFGSDRWPLKAPLTAVVLLNWKLKDEPVRALSIELGQRPDLLAGLIKSPGVHYYPADGEARVKPPPADYLAALDGVRSVEITGGVDFAAVVTTCNELTADDSMEKGSGVSD